MVGRQNLGISGKNSVGPLFYLLHENITHVPYLIFYIKSGIKLHLEIWDSHEHSIPLNSQHVRKELISTSQCYSYVLLVYIYYIIYTIQDTQNLFGIRFQKGQDLH